jgi:hypothetical protein
MRRAFPMPHRGAEDDEMTTRSDGAPLQGTAQQTREAIREQVRQSIEQARIDAARARDEARSAMRSAQGATAGGGTNVQVVPQPPVPPVPGAEGHQVIVTPDGRTIVVDRDGNVEIDGEPITEVPPQDFPFGPGGPEIPVEAVVMFVAFCVMIVLVAVGIPISRAFGRRIDRRSAVAPELSDLGHRLDRIEQAIETVAVEVERISEGQRYTARLMSELQPQRIPAGESGR